MSIFAQHSPITKYIQHWTTNSLCRHERNSKTLMARSPYTATSVIDTGQFFDQLCRSEEPNF